MVDGEALKPPVITTITFRVGPARHAWEPRQFLRTSQHGVLFTTVMYCYGITLLSIRLNFKTVQIVKSISWQPPHSPPHMQRGMWQWKALPSLSWSLAWSNHRQESQGTWTHPIVTIIIYRRRIMLSIPDILSQYSSILHVKQGEKSLRVDTNLNIIEILLQSYNPCCSCGRSPCHRPLDT